MESIKDLILKGDITQEEIKEYIQFVVSLFIVSGITEDIEQQINEFFKQYNTRFIITIKTDDQFNINGKFYASVIPVYCMN